MFNILKKTLSANILSAFLNFVFLYLVSQLFSDFDANLLFVIFSIVNVAVPIVEFGLVDYLASKKSSSEILIRQFCCHVLVAIFLVYFLSKFLNLSEMQYFYVLVYSLSLFILRYLFGVFQRLGKWRNYSICLIFPQITKYLVAYYAYNEHVLDIFQLLFVVSLVNSVFAAIMYIKNRELIYGSTTWSVKSYIYRLIPFGLPAIVITLYQRIDVFYLSKYVDDTSFSQYFLIANLALVFQIITRSTMSVYLSLGRLTGYEEFKSILWKGQLKLSYIIPVLIVGLMLIPKNVLEIYLGEFDGDVYVAFIMLSLTHTIAIYFNPFESIFIVNNPNALLRIKLIGLTVLGIAMLISVPIYGIIGAAASFLGSRVVAWGLVIGEIYFWEKSSKNLNTY